MIEGTATFTIVASTMIIETPRLSMARPSQRPRPSSCMAAPPALAESVTGVVLPRRLGSDAARDGRRLSFAGDGGSDVAGVARVGVAWRPSRVRRG